MYTSLSHIAIKIIYKSFCELVGYDIKKYDRMSGEGVF